MGKNTTNTAQVQRRVYRRAEVAEMLGVHIATIDKLIADGRLPKPQHLGPRLAFWPCAVIDKIFDGQDMPEVDMTDAENPAVAQ